MDEKRLFIVGMKLVGIMNILGGIVAFLNYIPVLQPMHGQVVIPNQFTIFIYRMVAPIIQVLLGAYLLKDGQAVVNFAYGMKSQVKK